MPLAIALFAAAILSGCLDGGAANGGRMQVEITTGYDERASPDAYREWGFEEGRPAAGAEVIVKLFDPAAFPRGPPPRVVGHDPNAGESNETEPERSESVEIADSSRAREADSPGKVLTPVERGATIRIAEGNTSHDFLVQLDDEGRATLFVESNGTVSVGLRVLRGPLESTDECERQYFDGQLTLVEPFDRDQSVHVRYGVSCRSGSP